MMEPKHFTIREQQLLHNVCRLPQKMLAIHGTENITEFVLHELCSPRSFNLSRAAYFIDNPDFDCLKGVAGYAKEQAFEDIDEHWQSADNFTNHMRSKDFNKTVRTIVRQSSQRHKIDEKKVVKELADQLGIKNPGYYGWNMKHDNHGILLYEQSPEQDLVNEHLPQCVHFFGFCPIF